MTENGRPDPARGGLRRLALADRHEALSARFAPFAGWEMPLQYEGIVAEHQAVRERAGVFDVSHLGRARLRGPGAGAALRSVTTFDVLSLEPGVAHYSLYCTEDGGIADDVFIYRLPDDRWLVVHNAENTRADFERLADAAGDLAEEATAETAMLAVQGPEALGVMEQVLGPAIAELEQRHCAELDWRGAAVLVARTGYTGEDGGECIIAAAAAGELWDALLEAGATPAGLGARDTLRLEAALPLHGHDIDTTTNPFEAGLGFAVSLDDGALFSGRDALVALKQAGRSRRLAHLRALERGVPRQGYAVLAAAAAAGEGDTQQVGALTSGAYSPTLRVGIGMAYLPLELAAPGTSLAVDVRGRSLPVEVVRRPFYRRPSKT